MSVLITAKQNKKCATHYFIVTILILLYCLGTLVSHDSFRNFSHLQNRQLNRESNQVKHVKSALVLGLIFDKHVLRFKIYKRNYFKFIVQVSLFRYKLNPKPHPISVFQRVSNIIKTKGMNVFGVIIKYHNYYVINLDSFNSKIRKCLVFQTPDMNG